MTDLFNGLTETPEGDVDPAKNYVDELVGEGKKFKTIEDLARGKVEADNFILRLQREKQGVLEDLKARMTIEEFVTKLNNQEPQARQNQGESLEPPVTPTANPTADTPVDLEKRLDELLTQREQKRLRETNTNIVARTLSEKFGPNYVQELTKRAAERELSQSFLTNLAAENPSAFFKLLDINEAPKAQPADSLFTPRSSVNTAATQPTGNGTVKNKAYYDDMRRKNPAVYWSSQVQNEEYQNALKLGEDFYK